MQLSDLSWSIRGTLGRKLLKKSQQYEGVVDFTLGDPDIPTPDGICDAAINAIREHKKRYTAAGGIAPLRPVFVRHLSSIPWQSNCPLRS